VADLFRKASDVVETSSEPREFVAQGDRVLVVGFSKGRVKATNRTFEDHWIFAMTVQNGKVTNIREYIDTLALARASEMAASPRPSPVPQLGAVEGWGTNINPGAEKHHELRNCRIR
jgi:hypothetical protein